MLLFCFTLLFTCSSLLNVFLEKFNCALDALRDLTLALCSRTNYFTVFEQQQRRSDFLQAHYSAWKLFRLVLNVVHFHGNVEQVEFYVQVRASHDVFNFKTRVYFPGNSLPGFHDLGSAHFKPHHLEILTLLIALIKMFCLKRFCLKVFKNLYILLLGTSNKRVEGAGGSLQREYNEIFFSR